MTGTLKCFGTDEAAMVRATLPEHIRLSRTEPGCLRFRVDPTGDPFVWRLDEAFVDQDAFDAHQTRTRGSVWFQVAANLRRDFRITDDTVLAGQP